MKMLSSSCSSCSCGLFLLFLFFLFLQTESQTIQVTTQFGEIHGIPCPGNLDGNQFLGIPYAYPPLGELRWKRPQPWNQTFPQGKWEATNWASECMQPGPFYPTSEDCLYLNVFTPSNISSNAQLPVMFWIYGGGFFQGTTEIPYYNGCYLANNLKDIIVVSVNYRLGPFGFLARSDLLAEDSQDPTTGLYGILDQQEGLKWVQNNIASFGGDPTRVMIFGESAGAVSVLTHLVAPGSAGLFSAAMAESGSAEGLVSLQEGLQVGQQYGEALNCSDLDCLRAIPADQALNALPFIDFVTFQGTLWFPVSGINDLPDSPINLITQGKYNSVPIGLGSNHDEGTLFVWEDYPTGNVTEQDVYNILQTRWPDYVDQILAEYTVDQYNGSYFQMISNIWGDSTLTCPTLLVSQVLAQQQTGVWKYFWDHTPSCPFIPTFLGATHFTEVPYVFNEPYLTTNCSMKTGEVSLSSIMGQFWAQLSINGEITEAIDPSTEESYYWSSYGAPNWTNIEFRTTSDNLQALVTNTSDFHSSQCNFWFKLFNQTDLLW